MAALLLLPLILLTAAFLLELSVDASPWRTQAERAASQALGHPVKLQGRLELQLGRQFGLQVEGLSVPNSPGFTHAELLTLRRARVSLDVLAALRGQLLFSSIAADDANLQLERASDGRDNWSGDLARNPGRPRNGAIDIGRLSLRNLALQYQDHGKNHHYAWKLSELSASARAGQAVQVAVRVHADFHHAYDLTFSGGPLTPNSGAEPQRWPFKLGLGDGNLTLRANGDLTIPQSGLLDSKASIDFEARAEELSVLAGRFKYNLPPGVPTALRGRMLASTSAMELQALQGRLGASNVTGQVAVKLASARPRLEAALNIDTLDFAPWLDLAASGRAARASDPINGAGSFALRRLLPEGVDLKLELQVARSIGAPLEIEQVVLSLNSDAQVAAATLTAQVSGAPVMGRIDIDNIDARSSAPAIEVKVTGSDIDMTLLAGALGSPASLDGRLGQLDLRLRGQAETLDSLVATLELDLRADALQLNYRSQNRYGPLAGSLHSLRLKATPGGRLRAQASGLLQGKETHLSLSAGSLKELWRESASPVELALRLLPSNILIRLDGSLSLPWKQTSDRQAQALSFSLHAPRSGDLAAFLPIEPNSKLAIDLNGSLQLDAETIRLANTRVNLGRSELLLDAQFSRLPQGQVQSQVQSLVPRLNVNSRLLDLRELSSLQPQARPQERPAAPEFGVWPDLDLNLHFEQLLLPRSDLAALEDLRLAPRLRDGRLVPTALSGRIAGQALSGQIEIDPRGHQATLKLELGSTDTHIGDLLRGLGAAENVEGRVDAMTLSLSGQGNDLRELAAQAALQVQLQGGRVSVLGLGRRPITEIEVKQAFINAGAGQALQLQLEGSLDRTPVKLALSTGTLADLARSSPQSEPLPFRLEARAAGAELALEGLASLPLGRSATLSFEASGERLDSLTPLLLVNLPPWGPWRLRGPVRITQQGYAFEQLRLRVGESQLGGTGAIELGGPRPRLVLRVSGRRVQLADFPTPKLTADPQLSAAEESADTDTDTDTDTDAASGDGLRGQVGRLARRTESLLSAGFLRRFDADIDVVAREILSGNDRLADGELHLRLNDGRLRMDPAFVNLPGGGMRLTASFDPTGEQVEFETQVAIERFDYGIIARRMGRPGDVQGLFSMKMHLIGKADSLDTVLRRANGEIDVAVWPTNLRDDVFNLWAVNLILNLVPLFEPGGQAQMNCVVARFDLKDGRLTEDNLTIDSTRVRVRGSGFANLATDELSFLFRPRAKGFALFRLQTPLRVTGTLDNQRIGIQRSDLIGSTIRSVLSPVWLPIERLLLGPNPPDGADVCTDPLRTSTP